MELSLSDEKRAKLAEILAMAQAAPDDLDSSTEIGPCVGVYRECNGTFVKHCGLTECNHCGFTPFYAEHEHETHERLFAEWARRGD